MAPDKYIYNFLSREEFKGSSADLYKNNSVHTKMKTNSFTLSGDQHGDREGEREDGEDEEGPEGEGRGGGGGG
jgi:hypothetical protein